MKLDYLQFLELEVFTRFGAKLEATMEAAIKRGKILRELFKQNRLSPQTIEFQLAWLIAFNEDLFLKIEIEHLPTLLKSLKAKVSLSTLTLDSPRDEWQAALADWLNAARVK